MTEKNLDNSLTFWQFFSENSSSLEEFQKISKLPSKFCQIYLEYILKKYYGILKAKVLKIYYNFCSQNGFCMKKYIFLYIFDVFFLKTLNYLLIKLL